MFCAEGNKVVYSYMQSTAPKSTLAFFLEWHFWPSFYETHKEDVCVKEQSLNNIKAQQGEEGIPTEGWPDICYKSSSKVRRVSIQERQLSTGY